MILRAKFASTCPVCGLGISVKEKISYVKGRPAEHAGCSEEAGRLAPQAPLFEPRVRAERVALDLGEHGVGTTANLISVTKEIRSVLVICPAGDRARWLDLLKGAITREMAIGLTGWGPHQIHWTQSSRTPGGSITICDYDNLARLGDRQTWDLLVLDTSGLDEERARVATDFCARAARHLTTTIRG